MWIPDGHGITGDRRPGYGSNEPKYGECGRATWHLRGIERATDRRHTRGIDGSGRCAQKDKNRPGGRRLVREPDKSEKRGRDHGTREYENGFGADSVEHVSNPELQRDTAEHADGQVLNRALFACA